MITKKKLAVYVGITALLLASALTAFAQVAPEYPRDETLIVDILSGRDPNAGNFNIWVPGAGAWDKGPQQLSMRPLWMAAYVKGEVLNVLAKEPPIYNDDFTQMTVKLREGIYWSDGVEFTADDVVFTVKTLLNNPGMLYSAELRRHIDKVRKTGKYTVVFDLKEPNSRFHAYFLDRWGGVRIMPEHVWAEVEDPMKFKFNPPVSLGAYVLEDFDPTGYWFLWRRRDDWERTVVGKLYGKPKPKYVLYYYYGPPQKKVMAQAKHELDMCDLTTESMRAIFKRNEYSRGYRKNFPWVVNVDPCITGIMLNNAKYPFNIKDVRWALTLAIDIVSLEMNAFGGTATMGALHLPPTPAYLEWYYKPMQSWLKDFTLDIKINGEFFKPYDPDAPLRLAEHLADQGYSVPEEPEEIKDIWGYGWWKYAPEVAEKLLERHGFTRNKEGKWLLPNGKPWKIIMVSPPDPHALPYRNAFAAAQEWRRFGIDVEVQTSEMDDTIVMRGQYDAAGVWPAREPWGAHPDLYRTFHVWHSDYYASIGEMAAQGPGGSARYKSVAMDFIVEQLRKTAWGNTDRIKELGIEGLKIAVEAMPTIPTVAYPGIVAWDTYYWTGYPGAEDPYTQPYHHWPNFGFMLPFLEPTGRK